MIHRSVITSLTALALGASLWACGNSTPTAALPARSRGVEATITGTIDLSPHSWSCVADLPQRADGEVSAEVSLSSLYLELRSGSCSSPGILVAASSTRTLRAVVPVGNYAMMAGNPTDSVVHFAVVVRYLG
jgi:hypothetical protein